MATRFSNLASLVLAALPIVAILGVAQIEAAARVVGL